MRAYAEPIFAFIGAFGISNAPGTAIIYAFLHSNVTFKDAFSNAAFKCMENGLRSIRKPKHHTNNTC